MGPEGWRGIAQERVEALAPCGAGPFDRISRTTDGQPWSTLGYFGTQSEASRSLRFEILSDRAAIFPIEPKSGVSQGGGSLGDATPIAAATKSKNSRCVTGALSTTL